jgi:N4-gp56 family major capsid protein
MRTFYDDELLDIVGPKLVHDQDAVKKPIPANRGKKIQFRGFSPLPKVVTTLVEGVTPDGGKLNMYTIEAEISQYGYYITVSDLLDLTHVDNVIAEGLKGLGDQAGVSLDTVSRNVLVSGTSVFYAPKLAAGPGSAETEVTSRKDLDTTCVATVDLVEQIVTEFEAGNVPKFDDGFYHAIIHPFMKYDLMHDPRWRDPHKYVDTSNLYNGELGEVGGVRFMASSEAKIFRGDDLASDSRTLTVNHGGGYSGAITGLAFDGGTVEDDALIGRKILINGVSATITDNTSSTLTFASTNFGSIADDAYIYPGEGGKEGISVMGSIFYGKDAYATTEVEGGGLETIVHQLGSGGTEDPLSQRATIGWKATKVTEILHPDYIIRLESVATRKPNAAAN